jgi:hypothetical protein
LKQSLFLCGDFLGGFSRITTQEATRVATVHGMMFGIPMWLGNMPVLTGQPVLPGNLHLPSNLYICFVSTPAT